MNCLNDVLEEAGWGAGHAELFAFPFTWEQIAECVSSGLLSHASSLCPKVSSHAGRGFWLSIFADNSLDKSVLCTDWASLSIVTFHLRHIL